MDLSWFVGHFSVWKASVTESHLLAKAAVDLKLKHGYWPDKGQNELELSFPVLLVRMNPVARQPEKQTPP